MDAFVNLHRHDSFSQFDGLDVPLRATERAILLGQPALGVSNHGNVYGLVDHYRVCADRGLKPVLGIELYTTDKPKIERDEKEKVIKPAYYHQTVFVETAKGYRNLMRLVSRSYDLFYYRPMVTLDMLAEYGEGLIILTGCPSSMIQRAVQEDRHEDAEKILRRLIGEHKGRLYVELQHHDTASKAAKWLVERARHYRLPIVATNDAHYVDPEDRPLHDKMLASRRKGKGEENPTYGEGFHIVRRAEMGGMLKGRHSWLSKKDIDEALDNTVAIADRVTHKFERSKRMLPPLWGNEAESRDSLRRFAIEGLKREGLHRKPEYVERLKYELRVVEALGYPDYFHVVREVTTWARKHDILIGPRGSVCGSLLAYVIGVTTVDPLVHGTIFERFLHEQKKAVPDVDLDIDIRHHDRVIQWVLKRFRPYAYPIIAFGRSGGANVATDLKGMFPDVKASLFNELRMELDRMKNKGRVFLATPQDVDSFAGDVLADLEKEEPNFPWRRAVLKLYSAVRYVGKHPGGVCFVSGDPTEWMALTKSTQHNLTMTSYPYLDVEYLGLLKLDFLGLAAMTVVNRTMRMAKERMGGAIDSVRQIPLTDHDCYERFASGDTIGMFQFETPGARGILKEIEPENFQELTASTALNRPGVSDNIGKYIKGKEAVIRGETVGRHSGRSLQEVVDAWVSGSSSSEDEIGVEESGEKASHHRRSEKTRPGAKGVGKGVRDSKKGMEKAGGAGQALGGTTDSEREKVLAEQLEDLLAPTYGAIVYQETITQMLRALGMSWLDGDVFLKAIKSHTHTYSASFDEAKGQDVLNRLKGILAKRGLSEERAQKFVEGIARYSFNKAHAVGYTLVAYWMMWLRLHYPLEFWVCLLNVEGFEDKRVLYERQAAYDGLILLPPHVNGTADYSIDDNGIRVGLKTLKGVGEKAATYIELNRPYKRASDLLRLEKKVVNARVKKVLLAAGALEMDRAKIVERATAYNNDIREKKVKGSAFFHKTGVSLAKGESA